jgi:hypothetical protein
MIVIKYDKIFTEIKIANRNGGLPLVPTRLFENRCFDIFTMRFFVGEILATVFISEGYHSRLSLFVLF